MNRIKIRPDNNDASNSFSYFEKAENLYRIFKITRYLWKRSDLKHIGALIEMPPLYENLIAYENLKVRTTLLGLDDARINEVLQIVRLTNTGKKRAGQFSLGMKQRLGIAIALLNNPQLLILDEPTNGLDPLGIEELRELIRSFPHNGMTVILSSHQMLLERAIMNVINNAVDYSSPGATIYMAAEKVDSFLQITITDEGNGFTPETLHHAKEQFFMGEKSRTSNMHFGMGLYITSSIVNQHNGQLILRNSDKTNGAQVMIKIPY